MARSCLPVDSEHNAIFQSLPADFHKDCAPVVSENSSDCFGWSIPNQGAWLTLHDVTPDAACAHPNWVMGRKISVDSATMMNKGLEVIEAHWLFAAPAEHDTGCCSSAERYPFSGSIQRWFGACANGQSGYADADCLCNGVS
jgi:1-deoxy-D-xylulose 5-phosphate reductoisomerase